jgi:predicted transcriptional regulator
MPQFTIEVPDELMPVLARKAQAWNRSAERFLVDYIAMCLENEEEAPADMRREALEDILEERDKGPFITVTDMKAFREGVRARVMERVQQRHHA